MKKPTFVRLDPYTATRGARLNNVSSRRIGPDTTVKPKSAAEILARIQPKVRK